MSKKIICFIFKFIILFSLFSCSNIKNTDKWKKVNEKEILLSIEPGDIIIKEKTLSIFGMFGHSAIMKDKIIMFDYPKFGETSYEMNIKYWLEEHRDIIILRYKDMNDTFKEKLIKNIEKYSGKK